MLTSLKHHVVNIFGISACVGTIVYALHVEHMLPVVELLA